MTFVLPVARPGLGTKKLGEWLRLLSVFDPDELRTACPLPEELVAQVVGSTLIAADAPGIPDLVRDVMSHRTIPARTVWSQSGGGHFEVAAPTDDEFYDLWRFSRTGLIPAPQQQDLGTDGALFERAPDRGELETRVFEFCTETNDRWPLKRSLAGLGSERIFSPLPTCIVLGDEISDWALFQSLQYLRPRVSWLPPRLLRSESRAFDRALRRLRSTGRRSETPIVVSASMDAAEVGRELVESLERVGGDYGQDVGCRVVESFADVVPAPRRWGEVSNIVETTMVFQSGVSLGQAPRTRPSAFKVPVDDAKFVVDLFFPGYRFLAHPACAAAPVQWPVWMPPSGARRSRVGDLVLDAVRPMRFEGESLEDVMVSPRIRLPEILSDFNAISSREGMSATQNDKGDTSRTVLALWAGNLAALCADMVESDAEVLFRAYASGEAAKQSLLSKAYGISLRGEILLSPPLIGAFKQPPKALTDEALTRWIDSGVLLRGVVARCRRCGARHFYGAADLTDSFRCFTCREEQQATVTALGSMEPRLLYRLNPVVAALQREASDVALWGVKKLQESARAYVEWCTEVDLKVGGRVVQEVDLVANVDGRLLLGECKSRGKLGGDQLKAYVDLCVRLKVPRFACITLGEWAGGTKEAIRGAFKGAPLTAVEFIDGPKKSASEPSAG